MKAPVQQDPLAALHPIHLPAPVSWWPPAPGWWLLLLLLIVLIVVAWYVWKKQRKRSDRPSQKQMIAAALHEYDSVDAAIRSGDTAAPAQLSALMRRVAIQMDTDAAGMTGEAWLAWLDSRWPRNDFSSGAGRMLSDLPYRRATAADIQNLSRICRDWLRAQQ